MSADDQNDDEPDEPSDDADDHDDGDEGGGDGRTGAAASPATRRGLVLIGVLLLGLVIGRVTAPGEESPEPSEEATEQGLPFPTGDVDRANYWGLAGLLPRTRDDFDRADGDLGTSDTGQDWEVVSGDWAVETQRAVLTSAPADGAGIAVVPEGEGPGLTEVTVYGAVPGSGLVFRYLDPENHWTLTARPTTGLWTVTRVVDGRSQVAGEFRGSTADGVTITVIQNEEVLRFLVDGEDQFLLTDPELSRQRQGGMIAPAAAAATTSFDRFLVMGFREEGE